MKSTGIVRKMDKLGRIVLPVELRKSLKIDLNTPLEMFVDGDYILLKKSTDVKINLENIIVKSKLIPPCRSLRFLR